MDFTHQLEKLGMENQSLLGSWVHDNAPYMQSESTFSVALYGGGGAALPPITEPADHGLPLSVECCDPLRMTPPLDGAPQILDLYGYNHHFQNYINPREVAVVPPLDDFNSDSFAWVDDDPLLLLEPAGVVLEDGAAAAADFSFTPSGAAADRHSRMSGAGYVGCYNLDDVVSVPNVAAGHGEGSGRSTAEEEDHRLLSAWRAASEKKKKEEDEEEESWVGNKSTRSSSMIGFEEVGRYFCMPIAEAARNMKVGLTVLKKRCRELGISRWPHRKMKSLNSLIRNVQELGKGVASEECIRKEVETLEEHKRLMEMKPEMLLSERTKKLRQACFKANFKKRRAAVLQ